MIKSLENYGTVALDKSFKQLTTLRVGGAIKVFFEPIDIRSLVEGIKIIKAHNTQFKIIGFGSNLLCSDNQFDGVVIKLSNLNHFEINGEELYAEAGAAIITIANFAINNGLSGLQFATGIPATVGGALLMNAGAYNEQISDVVEAVLVYRDNHLVWIDAKDLAYSYRTSIFKSETDWIIVAVNFKLKPDKVANLKNISIDRNKRRWESQPINYPNCGSVFENKKDIVAWRLIDEIGLRGKQIGGAQISEKHSNFIVNVENSKADDVNDLINLVKKIAKESKDIDLHLEVERFNW